MKRIFHLTSLLMAGLSFSAPITLGQQPDSIWNLQQCINYAIQNNIQVKKVKTSSGVSQVQLDEAKAARLPGLSGEVNESYTHQQPLVGTANLPNSFTGNYSLHSGMVLYNDNKLNNAIHEQQLNVKSGLLNVKESENNIEIAVTSAYLQIMFARENLMNAKNTVTSSLAQLKEAGIQYHAGYISESSYAQLGAQYSSDRYAEVQEQNNLDQQILSLKQLLELDIGQELDIEYPALSDSMVMDSIPPEETVYKTALIVMPEVQNAQLGIDIAKLETKIARAGLMPELSLSAGASTGYNSDFENKFTTQLHQNFYQNLGLSLSIPIYSNRQERSAVSLANLNMETAELVHDDTQKTLLSEVETAWTNAVAARSRFRSSIELLKSAGISYRLTEQQFNLGMKNTVDLLTAKVKYLSAQQEYLQAKYSAILNYKLLDFYQGNPIVL